MEKGDLVIDPFVTDWRDDWKGEGKPISYGLSSAGYDVRLKNPMICLHGKSRVLDPKMPKEEMAKNFSPMKTDGNRVVIPPGGCILAESVEKLSIPNNIVCICQSKSTFVRIFTPTLVSPLEPGWSGTITLEFVNCAPIPSVMYLNEGCVQVMFFKMQPVEKSYGEKGGRYQDQEGVTFARG